MKQLIEGNSYNITNKPLFEIKELRSVPQRFIKWIPKSILNILKRFFGNVIVELRVKIRVLK